MSLCRPIPWCITLIVFAVTVSQAFAGYHDAPPPLAGWDRDSAFPDDTPERHGVVLSGAPVVRSSPLIAEIDGNTANGLEVAVGGSDGTLYVYTSDGNLLWSVDVTPQGCSSASIESMPAVGALHGDNVPYLLVTYDASACDGGLLVYDGATGAPAWGFSLSAWQATEGYAAEAMHGSFSSPVLADTEGDGQLEIAFGAFDRNVYLLNSDGSVRWYYHAADTVWSSPLFMDVDGDGPLELVVGTDISANPDIIPPMTDGGFVYAFDTHARSSKRIDFGTGFLWRTPNLNQVIFSSPVVGDVLANNPGDEIVIGNGCFFPVGTTDKEGKWVKILRPVDGAVLQTLDVPAGGTCVQSSGALGDIDDDGKLEIVFTMGSGLDSGGDGLGRIVAWDPENPTPKWSTVLYSPHESPSNAAGNDAHGGDLQSPVIADLDGNGSLEVLAANFWSIHVLAGTDGTPLTCQDNTCGSQISVFGWGTLHATPAVADMDGDGDLEVVTAGMNVYAPGGRGMLYAWTDFAGLLGSAPGSHSPYSAPWPSFHPNPAVVGSPGPPPPEPEPERCEEFDEPSAARIQCQLDELMDEPPCVLPKSVSKKLKKASATLAAAGEKEGELLARLARRAQKQLSVARRKAGSRRVASECRATLRQQIQQYIQLVRGL
jgi:hypothetical protein